MVEQLNGTKNDWGWCKEKLGANAILAVSLATARAGAHPHQPHTTARGPTIGFHHQK